ncbi:NAD-dependent epimerase/dehydratase family protein [Halomonas sp. IOP_31]|uniref:NAD-dependent epimerase/dehydratase family protein n=1 Tax=Halomonas sp. IOP_31 TaxID=2876584 RepID=UPI001E3F320E|nr:NAD(P)-dependent oxidoreductase [Halomonas sp. IOP_31]MCD6009892.1 NAD(P)-dependent oxidoreductase [Halomonas sp. IOP_31]
MINRLLVTGAAGGMGRLIRPQLATLAKQVRLSDIGDLGEAASHEELVTCDLADAQAVSSLVEGCDAIIHLGGVSLEKPWNSILQANIIGTYNLYEAARQHGKPRIIFASSNHTTGYYERTQKLDTQVPHRPDSIYGVSKCFGEDLACLYYHKFDIETLSVRIGWCHPKPTDTRKLAIWLSGEDFVSLAQRALSAPKLGYTVVYGASNNSEQWWDNSKASFLGWVPKDSSEPWREEIEGAAPEIDPQDPTVIFQGGPFATFGHPDD